MEIDKLNKRILQLLQRDGRITYKDITKEMDRAESTVRERISFMEEQGIIEGYTAIIDKPRVGLNCSAIVYAKVPPTSLDEIAGKLKLVNGVLQIYHSSGDKNLVFFMTASDFDELNRIIKNKITPLGINDIKISIILKAVREIAEVNILSVDEREEMERAKKKKQMAPTPAALKSSGMKVGEALGVTYEHFKV
ncbi:Lrp/AsnC family transcriptional regulator [Methanocella sp. CWC-04]|uniref:Lrp/AsnC family transcriptional regulator n=1 Tax=Methanooceanicella nereidis TaxID=2052831 RepID=A0AAP2W3Z5_9EURY|nr:Lrp/AsnC family transcriptional regulator [Methanocella sp. CWC-04]MCD1293685.1 Lrp/AsnC family transcriptional regulator [Methanocella sp. CWC-04]